MTPLAFALAVILSVELPRTSKGAPPPSPAPVQLLPAPAARPTPAVKPPPPPPDTRCVADGVTGAVVTAQEGERLHPLIAGDTLSGMRAVVTSEGARARLVFPGWTVILGPATRVEIGPPNRHLQLVYGSLRLENRPGDTTGPDVVVGTRLVAVHVPSDGRTLVSVTRGTRKVPDTMKVITLRGSATLAPYRGTTARLVPEGCEVIGAGWIAIARWAANTLTPQQRASYETRSLMRAERAQLPGKAPLIPVESLAMDGSPLAQNRTMYLSRADIPPEGRVAITGRVAFDRVPRTLGEVYVAASQDGGETWERLKWADAHGGFLHEFTLQDDSETRLQFGVFQVAGAKLYETTPVFPIVYREQFLPALSDFKICGQALPLDGATLSVYSDELVDYAVLFEGTVRCDAPLARVCVEVSPDAGVRWRRATILPAPAGEPSAGTFRVAFTPVPGAGYRFRVRTTYSDPTEKARPHQVLSDFDAPGLVRYMDQRSGERLATLVRELETALRASDTAKVGKLISPQFNIRGRDFSRARGVRLHPGAVAREAGTTQIAVDWERDEPVGAPSTGHAIFLYVKQADFALVEVLGDDPFSARGGRVDDADVETATIALGGTYDFEEHRAGSYDEAQVPDDVALFRDDQGALVLGTHDRRLAVLTDTTLAAATPGDRSRLEYRSTVSPQEGAVLYLKTRQGGEVVMEVQDAASLEARAPRLKIAYRFVR